MAWNYSCGNRQLPVFMDKCFKRKRFLPFQAINPLKLRGCITPGSVISKLWTCVPQQASIPSLHNHHSSVLLTEAYCVICEVPTDLLHTMWVNFSIHHGTGFDPRPFHVRLVVYKVTLGQFFFFRILQSIHQHCLLSEGRAGEVLKPWAEYLHGFFFVSSKGQPYVVPYKT